MKIINLVFIVMLLFSQQVLSNNIQVNNVRLTGQNTTDDFTMVEFDISWENSWRYSNGPANWDAAWIFVKYKVGAGGPWQHAWLNNTGHSACGNGTITNGFLNPTLPFNTSTNPALGVFLYRSVSGIGPFTCSNVQLRWNYGSNSVADNAQIDIRVFAIEMVYTPQGSVYVGTGGTEVGGLYVYPTTNVPYHITSELAIPVGTSTGNMYYNTAGGTPGDQQGPIPVAYPKGFKAFYALKYEISQKAYVDFLNTLTRAQQQNRVATDISGLNITNKFVMSGMANPFVRNSISCRLALPPQPGPVDFFCDLNNNGIGNEASDGLSVACNLLSYGDLAAYLDWAALRLMTELELEKCSRGSSNSVPNEFAWGNSELILTQSLLNLNMENEIPTDLFANMGGAGLDGPIRCGAFARAASNRTTSGAGYYGCMELSGNLWERGVSIGSVTGRSYTGVHGNGGLSVSGDADVVNWPLPANAIGSFLRGGSIGAVLVLLARVSDRTHAATSFTERDPNFGGRGVRTAE